MRELIVASATLALATGIALFSPQAGAQNFFGFRLLNLDGIAVKWGANAQQPVKLTSAIAASEMHFSDRPNCSAITSPDNLLKASSVPSSAFKKELRAAFDEWEKVAQISFVETSDLSAAKILIGEQLDPVGRAFTDVSYKASSTTQGSIERSLICLNPNQRWKIGFDGNLGVYDLRYTLAHEIGHAIGLDHPSASGQLMSFKYEERFQGLQAGDITGAATLYNYR